MTTTCAGSQQAQMTFDQYDVCAKRHRGNPESVDANRKSSHNRRAMQIAVYNKIKDAGIQGLTCREAAESFGKGMNALSGRFSELKADGLICKVGRREGCGVYIAVAPRGAVSC